MQEHSDIKGYLVEKKLGKGGMGEVFLVKDPICSRWLALKIIREELRKNPTIRKRFLQEARIAARLTHPNIVSIYTIYEGEDTFFYTMPYTQGETLKEILKTTREEELSGKVVHPIGSSIPKLLRIFLDICEAIAYSHSQGVLHRDLKPENIIIGQYGETLILDWGLACLQADAEEEISQEFSVEEGLTKPGKVPGTLSHMPPERALGHKSNPQTDVFALGVILYQILTLKLPFRRSTMKALRQSIGKEKVPDPCEIAPYRDIPPFLGDIARKCMAFDLSERYSSVDKLIADIKLYIEGNPHWIALSACDLSNPSDWLFQELVPSSSYQAVDADPHDLEWMMVMLGKQTVRGNFCMEGSFSLTKGSSGIGFLFNVPQPTLDSALEEGFSLWLNSSEESGCTLYHCRASVMESSIPPLVLARTYRLRIEKIDQHILVYLDGVVILNYLSHFPMTGDHVGFVCKDFHFSLEKLFLFSGSQRTWVSCLSIPDAFLTRKDFSAALSEYRKLASSFEGRSEGREALFRAGLTLLEQSHAAKNAKEKERLLLCSLDEFEKLRKSSGAPMEYLGKSLVYQALNDLEEEAKCLELGIRKYPTHPLTDLVIDQLLFRLYQSASKNRKEALTFALLAIRLSPAKFEKSGPLHFLSNLEKTLQFLLPFLPLPLENKLTLLSIQIAMVLDKPFVLLELLEKSSSLPTLENALMALLYLGHLDLVTEMLPTYESQGDTKSFFENLQKAFSSHMSDLNAFLGLKSPLMESARELLLQKTLLSKNPSKERLERLLEGCSKKGLSIQAYLFLKDTAPLKAVFKGFDSEDYESSLFIPYLSFLSLTDGKKKALKVLEKALKTSSAKNLVLLRLAQNKPSLKQLKKLLEKGAVDELAVIGLKVLGHCLDEEKLKNLVNTLQRLSLSDKKSQAANA